MLSAIKSEFFEGFNFVLIIYAIVTTIIIILAFLWARLRVYRDLQNLDHTNRSLKLEERRYLVLAIDELIDYADQIQNRTRWRFLYYSQFMVCTIVTASLALLVFPIENYLMNILIENIIDNSPYIAVTEPNNIWGAIPMYLLGFSLIWSGIYVLGIIYRRYGEYLYAYTGWDNVDDPAKKTHHLALAVSRYFRLGKISIDQEFSPREFLHRAFSENQVRTYLITVAAFFLVVIGIAADVSRYTIVTEDGILYSKLQEVKVRTAEYEDVDRVELRCFFYGTDNPPSGKLGLGYRLVKSGEFSINLLDDRDITDEDLASIENINSRLLAAGIPIEKPKRVNMFFYSREVIADGCEERVRELYSTEKAHSILRLLQLET